MQPKTAILPGLAAILLAACAGPDTARSSSDACGASAYQGLVGRTVSDAPLPSNIPSRIIGPATPVTADFVAERINFRTDAAGTIQRVACG